MNSSTLSFSPDSSGSDSIDWLTNTDLLYPDSGVHTDMEYPVGCVQGSELLAGFLQPDKPLENHCPPSFQLGSSQPSFAQESPTGYDPMMNYPQTPNLLPHNFDTEQYRLVHMRREYQKMLLDVEKKIIENKISWIDQANQADQMMTCPDPFLTNTAPPPPTPIPLPGENSSDKFSHTFPVFEPEMPLQDTHLPLDLTSKETQMSMPHPQGSVSKTHKIPVRRNSNSRIQPYTSHTPTSLLKNERREEAGEGVKKRQSHNAIEERYRKRINLRIQELKSIVAPDEPLPKSNILAKALIYIRDLEERNKSLEDRIVELSGFKSSSSSEPSPPNMLSSPPIDSSLSSNRQPRKNPRSNNSAKIIFCLLTIVLCLCAPDPVSLRELPSAFASRDQFGGLGSAVFRSRTLLYLSESSVGTSLRQSSSLIHPFSLLSWSVRLSLVSLSLVVLVYSSKLLFPRYISADQSLFIKLSRQAGVKFREKRLNQSLSLLETAFLDLGFYLNLSKPRLVISLFLESTYLSVLRLIHSTYIRLFTSCQRESELNLPLFHEVILSLHLFQRVQTARDCHLSSLYSALTAHSLAQSYKRLLPPYLVQYSRQSLLQLLHRDTGSLLHRLITAVLRLSVGYGDEVTSHVCTRQDLYFWCNVPHETEEWDFDKEIQTQVFCDELSVLLRSTISLRHTQEEDSRHALRFSAHNQSLPSPTDELTHWWATLAVMASEWKRGNTSDPYSYSNFFKNVPSSLITSAFVLPKALVLSSRFRLSIQSSSLHRPALLVRLSQEANELIWSSFQQDTLKADSKELFLLLQALCCKWVQDGLVQLWKKNGCVKTQYAILQSYLTVLFILDKLAQRDTFLAELLSHQTALTFTLSNSNPCQTGTQLDAIRQESLILSY